MKSATDATAEVREAFAELHEHYGAPAYVASLTFLDALADYYASMMLDGGKEGVEQNRNACLAVLRIAQALRDKHASRGFAL